MPAGLEPESIEGRSPWRLAWSRLVRDRVAIASLIVILLMVAAALAAPLFAALTGHSPTDQYRETGLTDQGIPVGPGAEFWLGTDSLGRDLFVRTVYGARISLLVGVVATLLATFAGVVIGLVAGYFGGIVDTILARAIDVVLSFPYLIFAMALVSVIGPSLVMTTLVIAFFSWASIARIVRGQTLAIKEKEYIEAARSLGASPMRIMFVDVLPNLVAPVIVLATLLVPTAIVFEATLSWLGLGVDVRIPSWGAMLAESQSFFRVAWWYLIFPAGALLLTTLAFNLLGDGVRDALDPRSERLFATRRKGKP
ncbi:MAG: ABC transporter permease subunit [Streptosporangiales bacterium]|nr:ABC transporter permease subunit [Streptosporangiales bacterium]